MRRDGTEVKVRIEPIKQHIGGIVHVDRAQLCDDEVVQACKDALEDRGVLVFPRINLTNAEHFREWVVVSIEKNRNGMDNVDLEFRKHFEHSRFDPNGSSVIEQLVDERIFVG